MNHQVISKTSINLLGGYCGGVSWIEVGGLFNIDKKDVKQIQLAGLFNLVGGNSQGLQASGIYNQVLGQVDGVQLGGIANIADREVKGLQAASILNLANAIAAQASSQLSCSSVYIFYYKQVIVNVFNDNLNPFHF